MIWGISTYFSQIVPMSQIPQKSIGQISLFQPVHLSKTSLDEKFGVENFILLSVYLFPWFVVYDPSIPKLP